MPLSLLLPHLRDLGSGSDVLASGFSPVRCGVKGSTLCERVTVMKTLVAMMAVLPNGGWVLLVLPGCQVSDAGSPYSGYGDQKIFIGLQKTNPYRLLACRP